MNCNNCPCRLGGIGGGPVQENAAVSLLKRINDNLEYLCKLTENEKEAAPWQNSRA